MRNEARYIELKEGWVLKVSVFKRQHEFGLGLTRKEWKKEGNYFTSKIILSEKATKELVRTLQKFLAKLNKQKKGEKKDERQKTNSES